MKKRFLSLVLSLVLLLGLLPAGVFGADAFDAYFADLGLPASVSNYSNRYYQWSVTELDDEQVVKSKPMSSTYSSSYITLTFTEDTYFTFEFKVSTGSNYNYFQVKVNNVAKTNSGADYGNNVDWTMYELDVKAGDAVTLGHYTGSSSVSNPLDNAIYLRNFSCGEGTVVTFHNGDELVTQKLYGTGGALAANPFTKDHAMFLGWALINFLLQYLLTFLFLRLLPMYK